MKLAPSSSQIVLLAFGAALAVFTQLWQLTAVPGFHFDEAWQAYFAHRIHAEPGFWPTGAMNSYTTPVIHYLLAAVYAVFGTTLATLRGFYAFLNFATLAALTGLLFRLREKQAAVWFVFLWALLPLSVHDHRFYVEMTGFFGACLAATLWGAALWRERPILSTALLTVPTLLATYSHILFIAVFIAGIWVVALYQPAQLNGARARNLIGWIAALVTPLTIRMGFGLGKILPFALGAALVFLALWSWRMLPFRQAERWWNAIPKIASKAARFLPWVCAPFLAAYTLLLWNGFWPYAQATGQLQLAWLPVNLALFAIAFFSKEDRVTSPLRQAFLIVFLISSVLILKQSPRYYMLATLLAMMWCALKLARLRSRELQSGLALLFVAWNAHAFRSEYIARFLEAGPTTHEFTLGPFHDNARDFRPFQKVFAWLEERGCQHELEWVEDDRFMFAVKFLQLAAPQPRKKCEWSRANLFFSHIPNYDPAFTGERNDANTPPPYPNVKFLAHFKEWGDLALWLRR